MRIATLLNRRDPQFLLKGGFLRVFAGQFLNPSAGEIAQYHQTSVVHQQALNEELDSFLQQARHGVHIREASRYRSD